MSFYICGTKETEADHIVEPSRLTERMPEYNSFFQQNKDIKQAYWEDREISADRTLTGMSKEKHFKHIARLPWAVAAALIWIDPNFFKDKERFHRFLRRHPEYRMSDFYSHVTA